MELFLELVGIVAIATGVAVFMKLLKQPLIVGYILAGILVGPYVLNLVKSESHIELFSKIGVTVLLFIVGLSLSPKVIREVGKVSLVTGLGQVIFTSIIGFLIALALGISFTAAVYISIALTFSSTIIILKLLSDRGDVHKLYGKISIGFLLVQDIVATVILLIVSSLAATQNAGIASIVFTLLLKGTGILLILFALSSYVIPKVTKFVAGSSELLFLFSITWGLGFAALFYLLGFSIEIGALIAGVALSITPFSLEIASKLKPLRDFFIVLFFVLLGSQMALSNIPNIIVPALILSLFVLVGNPIIVVLLMNLLGYKRRTGFMAGLTVAQISEFSLILVALGYSLGHVSSEMLSLVTFVGLITISGSTYFILYADRIYSKVESLLKLLELRKTHAADITSMSEEFELALFGYDRVGSDFVHAFKKLDKPYVVVDMNPASIAKLQKDNIPNRFGDAHDVEFLHELNLQNIKLAVSTIPDVKTNILLTKKIKKVSPKAIIITISHDASEAEDLYKAGASYVIMPHYLGAQMAVSMIMKYGIDPGDFREEREKHLDYIERRLHAK